MRPIQLAVLALSTLFVGFVGTTTAQESPASKNPPKKIDYSILAQPANASKVNLTDQQRAAIAEILDTRVNDLVAAEPSDREEIVAQSNAQIEALLSDQQKQDLAASLTGGKLQFNFYKQKWAAVLVWFAQQADLSLVMDNEPPGLFTYNDTREFTPSQAIDLLNSVLLSKNFTLIRRERMLVVVDTSQGVPYDLVQQVPLEKLSEFGRFEIVTTEFPLAGRPLAAVVEAVTPLVGDHGQVIPLAAANKLLVTETAGRLKAINVVIASIPVPEKPTPPVEPPKPVFQTYPAPGLDPETTTEVLRLLFPTATINFDPNAEVVHCQAPPPIQSSVKASVGKLVESVTGDNKARLHVYSVPAKRLASLVDQVALAHPTLVIDSDPEKNRLLVIATTKEHAEVVKTLASLDAMVEPSETDPQTVVLYPVSAASIAGATALLESVVPGALVIPDVGRIAVRANATEQELARSTIAAFTKRPVGGPRLSFYPLDQPLSAEMLAALTGAIPEATITWLAEEKKLSVLATLADHERVVQTLAQIKEVATGPKETLLVSYPVSQHQKSRLQLIQPNLTGELATMLLMLDSTPGQVIGWGTESQHKKLAKLLKSLKKNEPTRVTEPKRLDITVDQPASLVEMLKTRFPGVEMVFNEQAMSLYVWADDNAFEPIRVAFQTISATLPQRKELVTIAYPLKHADAAPLLALLVGMRPELNAAADPQSNQILVSAPLAEHARYKTLIDQLDSEPNVPREPIIQPYPLSSIEPAIAISILSPLFPEITLTSDVANRRIIGSGAAVSHQRLLAAIERIDVPEADRDTRLETYDLGDANPTQVVSVLTQLAPTAISTPSADGTKVYVWGDDAAQRTVAQAMEHLTVSDPKSSRSMKAHPLPKGIGSAVIAIMRPVAVDATLSMDATYKNLIAWATAEEHLAIEKAIKGLPKELKIANDKTTEVYRFRKSTPSAAYAVLRTLVPEATLAIDLPTSVLVATAKIHEHASIKSVVEKLESDSETSRSMKAYPLPKGAGPTAVTIMQPVAIDATLSLDAKYENLIVWATEEEHQAISTALERLRSDLVVTKDQTTTVYRLEKTTPTAVYTVLGTLVPEATLVVDLPTSSLVAIATSADHLTIKSVIDQIESDPETSRTMKAYPLPKGAGATAVTIMQPVAKDAKLSLDAKYENLIAWATEAEHQAIATAIEGLKKDLVESNDKTTEVYRFEKGTPAAAYTVLSRLMPDATLAIDTATSVLVATADSDQHATIQSVVERLEAGSETLRSMKAYPLPKGAGPTAVTIMQPVAVDATLSLDAKYENLIAWATEEEHQAIATAIEGLKKDLVESNDKTTEVYRFEKSTPTAAYTVLSRLMPDATLAIDLPTSVLVATADSDQHATIQSVVERLEAGSETLRLMKAYPLPKGAGPTAVTIMQPVAKDAKLSLDAKYENLIAWATEEEHQAIATAIEGLKKDLVESNDKTTEVYRFEKSTPTAAYTVLSRLMPDATLAIDLPTSVLVATADSDQHATIQSVVERLEAGSETLRSMKAYPLPKGAGPTAVTIMQPVAIDATLSLDAKYENLIAWATEEEHQAIATALERLRSDLVVTKDQTTTVYRLEKTTPTAAYTVLGTLVPEATLVVDLPTSSLVAIATSVDHLTIKSVIDQIESDPETSRTMKAYPLPRGAGATAVTIMQPVAKDAKLSLDAKYENLIAFATENEHQVIATAIDGLRNDLVNANDKSTKVYRFEKSSPTATYTVLATLVPEATMAVDSTASVLVATATGEEHALIESVVTQIEDDPESVRTMKAYPIPRGAATTALTIMQPVALDATFSLDETRENLIVWATEKEHQTIGGAVESLRRDLVNPYGDDQTVAVYPLDPELISATSLVDTFDDATIDRLSIMPNVETNSLIVRGSKEAQAKFAETIDTITSQLKKTNELQTHVYRFVKAMPTAALSTLSTLLPDATLAIDEETSVLVATATARQHETIAAVVKQIDTEESSGDRSTRVYRLHRASAKTVQRAFKMLTPKAEIGYDTGSNVIIATASKEDHKILQEAAAQVEGRASGGIIRIYPLTNVNASVAASAVLAIADGQEKPVDVQPNEESNSLVVVADEAQHKLILEAIEQLDADDRQLEVFELLVTDPFIVEMAISDLFGDQSDMASPSVSSDYETNKLFVRGTKRQVDQIRQLLSKLGESVPGEDGLAAGSGNTRTIRFPGETDRVVEQIKLIWPRLRKNRIEVITPSDHRLRPIVPSGAPLEKKTTDPEQPTPEPEKQSKQVPSPVPAGEVNRQNNGARLVLFQNTTRAPAPQESKQKPSNFPPIAITVADDRITISSDDTEALDRMESLLRAIAGTGRGNSSSNFAIFLLRNISATEVQLMLKKLFDDLPYQRSGLNTTVFVADDRINALIVHGNRQAREMIGQLLEVLDTQELPDPLTVYRSEIVTFEHARASRVLTILKNVYKTQLSSGGGRKPVTIPKGVTASVASVLQQINAVSSGPILTLDVDESTNSLIVRAPAELREEIRKFTIALDEQAEDSSNRSVRVIQLKRGKSDQIRAALEQFISSD